MKVPVFWMVDPEADAITSPFVRQPHYNDLENRVAQLEADKQVWHDRFQKAWADADKPKTEAAAAFMETAHYKVGLQAISNKYPGNNGPIIKMVRELLEYSAPETKGDGNG